jgi:ribosomal protein S14
MKLQIKKEKILRKKINNLEKKYLVFKYIIKNLIRYSLFSKTKLLKIRFLLWKQARTLQATKTKIVRRCLLSGRARSSIRLLNVSRIKMKELIKKGVIKNIRKRSW